MPRLLAVALLTLGLAAGPALAQTDADTDATIGQLLGEPQAYREAFDAIRAAVAGDDAAALAEWVSYPITVRVGGAETTIEDAGQFAEAYRTILTDEIGQAILDQQWATLFVNGQGVMLGNGEVWLNGICRDEACEAFDVRIVAIQSAP